MVGTKFGRVGLTVLLALALGLSLAAPASAAPAPGFITCVATPAVHVAASTTTPGDFTWTVAGSGACVAAKGTLTVAIAGSGTSTGLGLCTGLLVQNLDIKISMTVTRVFSGEVYSNTYHWVATISTFPEATPFAVNDTTGTTVGLGTIFTHIFFKCPPTPVGGPSDSSTVVWAQQFTAAPPA